MTIRFTLLLSLVLILSACQSTTVDNKNIKPKNIIMIVADGMGPVYPSAYRLYKDDLATDVVETTIFDQYLVGMSSTHPARQSGYVTDSAASATALAAGVKSYNGAIGVDRDKQPVQSVLSYAKSIGKNIGVIVTSEVNHATPAAYLSHNESRQNYAQLADSYIDNGWKADILLGGGKSFFVREDRNISNELQQQGVHVITQYSELNQLPDKPVLGLFAERGLPAANEDTDPLRLTTMVTAGLDYLARDNQQGFFALVEASQVDWAGHSNNIAHAMVEMDDLAHTLAQIELFVSHHPNTLVVLTADHSTGGLTIAANGKYKWDPSLIRNLPLSLATITQRWLTAAPDKETAETWFNTALTDTEFKLLSRVALKAMDKHDPNEALLKMFKRFIDIRTNTGWTTVGHTGIDVPVYAFGQGAELFYGHQDNTDIAKKIFTLLGKP